MQTSSLNRNDIIHTKSLLIWFPVSSHYFNLICRSIQMSTCLYLSVLIIVIHGVHAALQAVLAACRKYNQMWTRRLYGQVGTHRTTTILIWGYTTYKVVPISDGSKNSFNSCLRADEVK